MLLMAAKRWKVTALSVLCVRDQRGRLDAARSLRLAVTLPTIPEGKSLSTMSHTSPHAAETEVKAHAASVFMATWAAATSLYSSEP